MAIITFYSKETKETGQSLSTAALASYMAIEHNYKILVVSTSFNELTLENCFWEYNKIRSTGIISQEGNRSVGLESGVEGLIKVLNSNRTSNEIVKNYSRIVLRDRLDILLAPATKNYQEYCNIATYYNNILQIANRYYDMIFIDLSKKMPLKQVAEILQLSDIVVMNLNQGLKAVNEFIALKEKNEFFQKSNVMLAIGRYDKFSKYNIKNITRYLREKKLVSTVPYNTLFFEASTEGTVIDFMLKVKNITDETDRNHIFIKEVKELSSNIIFKLQELQMKI